MVLGIAYINGFVEQLRSVKYCTAVLKRPKITRFSLLLLAIPLNCSKRKWQLPDYTLVFDHGPAHHKQFLFKVLVNSVEYQPAVVCGNKKQAKAQAAIFALKGLGLIPEDAEISAV